MFALTEHPLDIRALRAGLEDPACGALVDFEGRVRDRHQGRAVSMLRYEAYPRLALKEGDRILARLRAEFGLSRLVCVHRLGTLAVGETAVWLCALGAHRAECFEAASRAMSLIKHRVPIWKHETYADGGTAWVLCDHGGARRGVPREDTLR